MNGVLASGCPTSSPGILVGAHVQPGVPSVYKLVMGPNVCTNPLSGTLLTTPLQVTATLSGGTCTPGQICGNVTAYEPPFAGLDGVTLELRSSTSGTVLQRAKSGPPSFPTGQYVFTPPAAGLYYVTPAVDRTQSATPSQAAVQTGYNADFKIRGIPSVLSFDNSVPGSFVLLTPSAAYPVGAMPVADTGSARYYSGVVGPDGKVNISVPSGVNYYYTCWLPPTSGRGAYTRTANTRVNGGTPLSPNTPITTGLVCH
jgi:hypothetical protein